MKLVSYSYQGEKGYGVVSDDRIIDLTAISHEIGATLRESLERNALARIAEWSAGARAGLPLRDVDFLPVIPNPQKILCVGINYLSHVKETGREVPKYPMIFTRFADSQVGHLQALIRPAVSDKLDFEGELAVVIGKPARKVRADRALDYVAGYSCYNDGSIRDWQRHTIQFIPGKNFPQTGGFGPWLVTTDEIPDPSTLRLTTRLNGKVVQQAPTSDFIFGVGRLVEYCSAFTPLSPGDIIITGTPGGVGAYREPPLWLQPGDSVEVEISKIGTLRNIVADETGRPG